MPTDARGKFSQAEQVKKRLQEQAAGRDAIVADRLLARSKGEAADWKKRYESVLAELEIAERRAALVENVSERIGEPREEWGRDFKQSRSSASIIAAVSDWHYEEDVDPATVDGKNEYTPAIAVRRAKRQTDKIIEYTQELQAKVKIDCVVLALLGDFITGYIHEELEESNHLSPTDALYEVGEVLDNSIRLVAKELKLPIVCVTARGNHGRTTKKKRIKTSAKNSYEHLLYRILARQQSQDKKLKNVRWQISEGYHNWLELYGRGIRFHHGDAINFWGGVGGITVSVNKAISQWNKVRPADLDIFGHFHQLCGMNRWVCNGSNIGYSDFAVEIKAEYEPPKQAFCVFDGKHGLRSMRPIFTDDVG